MPAYPIAGTGQYIPFLHLLHSVTSYSPNASEYVPIGQFTGSTVLIGQYFYFGHMSPNMLAISVGLFLLHPA